MNTKIRSGRKKGSDTERDDGRGLTIAQAFEIVSEGGNHVEKSILCHGRPRRVDQAPKWILRLELYPVEARSP
jgi:hypothetical protein